MDKITIVVSPDAYQITKEDVLDFFSSDSTSEVLAECLADMMNDVWNFKDAREQVLTHLQEK